MPGTRPGEIGWNHGELPRCGAALFENQQAALISRRRSPLMKVEQTHGDARSGLRG